MDKRADLLLALVVLVSGPFYYVWAGELPRVRMGDPLGTDGLPRALAVGFTLAGLWLVGSQAVRWRAIAGWVAPDEGEEDEAGYSVSLARLALVMVGMLAYVYALPLLGVAIATPLFIVAGLMILGDRDWRLLVGVAVGLTVVVYLTYGVALGVRLPMGPLGGL